MKEKNHRSGRVDGHKWVGGKEEVKYTALVLKVLDNVSEPSQDPTQREKELSRLHKHRIKRKLKRARKVR